MRGMQRKVANMLGRRQPLDETLPVIKHLIELAPDREIHGMHAAELFNSLERKSRFRLNQDRLAVYQIPRVRIRPQ